jgi:hypothetical protein
MVELSEITIQRIIMSKIGDSFDHPLPEGIVKLRINFEYKDREGVCFIDADRNLFDTEDEFLDTNAAWVRKAIIDNII